MAEQLKTLKRKRGNIKGQLTRLQTFIAELTSDSIIQLPERLKRCESLWNAFDAIQIEIEIIDDSEQQLRERIQFEDTYFKVISEIKAIISQQSANLNEAGVAARNSSNDLAISNNIKLPVIELPTFSGAYEQWVQFHDTFKTLVHSNDTISDVQKFYYLKASLKGDAAEVIHSLVVSDQNYVVAWNLLIDRFENKRLIIHNHVKALFEIQTIAKESVSQLRKLVDDVKKNLRALAALDQPTEHWDTVLIYLLANKLDSVTRREWEKSSLGDKVSKITDFLNFLTKRCQLLETVEPHKADKQQTSSGNKTTRTCVVTEKQTSACYLCKESHPLFKCDQFIKLPVKARFTEVQNLKLCWNCLRSGHRSQDCTSGTCRKCQKKHNTLLHFEENTHDTSYRRQSNSQEMPSNTSTRSQANRQESGSRATVSTHSTQGQDVEVLLSTALVHIMDKFGHTHECRALLDSGSQSSFISRELCDKLKVPMQASNIPVAGIGQATTSVSHRVNATIKSRINGFQAELPFLVLNTIVQRLPLHHVDVSKFKMPGNITLADPKYNIPSKIDILLGADIFWELLCVGQIRAQRDQPIIQKTKLGWIISGSIWNNSKRFNDIRSCNLSLNIQDQLERFWLQEECQDVHKMSNEEIECEEHFIENTERNQDGRFIVQLPKRDNVGELGASFETAFQRFQGLEKKLHKNEDFKKQYTDFMREYEELGHMSRINPSQDNKGDNNTYYIPHHGVYKEASTTTKLRVVFDASAKTDSGISLNDQLKVGPTIQDDLFAILLRFRKHRFVITADIAKMYRQVLVQDDQRDLQRILWRERPDELIQHYKLNTVTYGTATASFLAIRCLHQLGKDNREANPEASKVILHDFYVDDLLSGSNSIETTIHIRRSVSKILSTAGFSLRKWMSNNGEILTDAHEDNSEDIKHFISDDKTTKTLGLLWNSEQDSLQFTINDRNKDKRVTKRSILASISQIFDPLGLIGPTVLKAKIILQRLWQLKINWDESIPTDLHTLWTQFREEIPSLSNLNIPRHVVCNNPTRLQLHCFCDASEAAYGACIYARSTDETNISHVKLWCSKSKVAPLKKVSLPRLELCGALLLARLANKVIQAIDVTVDEVFYWCDSTIVLSWIAADSSQWKTFVANRVAEIQQLTRGKQWNHISGSNNPADIISRGLDPDRLANSQLWWNGPQWLAQSKDLWPSPVITNIDVPERKTTTMTFNVTNQGDDIFMKYSSLIKLQRVVAFCLRFKHNTTQSTKCLNALSVEELRASLTLLIKLAQAQSFQSEIKSLKLKVGVTSNSRLIQFNPFLDTDGVIRIGGRLKNSELPYEQRHQIILPSKHQLTKLIILNQHYKQLHAGSQALLASLRLQFWPLSGRRAVKSILSKCITCFRVKPTIHNTIMGNLPKARLIPTRPFTNCGVDYAGPFNIRSTKLRHYKIIKAYLCVFVCFVTKAVHLELVIDLSTDSFLNCFKRFIARRGRCSNIYSDNGTNFVGANNALRELYGFFKQSNNHVKLREYLAQESIAWHFIPPRSPHFGGLWESAVKSAKYHINRVVGDISLTFEELYTVITQVESCLNSRPLTPLSEDPNDLTALTPGHFLIGDSLNALPQADLRDQKVNRLNRYQHLCQIVQHFWSRWSTEYITQLQHRTKWRSTTTTFQVGDMVILKDENLPPLKWQLGRIVDLHPGDDGETRVVSVKTINGVFKRATSKMCVLPIDHSQ